VPDRVPAATVPSAGRVPDEGLKGAEAMPVGAVRRGLGDPLSTPSDEIADRHRMIVRLRTDSGRFRSGLSSPAFDRRTGWVFDRMLTLDRASTSKVRISQTKTSATTADPGTDRKRLTAAVESNCSAVVLNGKRPSP